MELELIGQTAFRTQTGTVSNLLQHGKTIVLSFWGSPRVVLCPLNEFRRLTRSEPQDCRTISLSALRAQLSLVIQEGTPYIVTYYGKPIAVLCSFDMYEKLRGGK